MVKTLLSFLLFLPLIVSCADRAPVDGQTVSKVDLQRYSGKWYEIASLPAPFQKDCFCSSAEYSLEDDHVKVVNRCRRGSVHGQEDEAVGKAWPVEGSNNSRLKVSFFWPFKGDYWVIGLDENYQWAIVGHPDKKYLWILSRKPHISPVLYKELIEKVKAMGYQTENINKTVQSCGE
jgi:apolipoprotein D and lipocalin family protein